MKNNKLEIKRRYRGKTTYLRGTFQMKGKKMSLHLLEYENKRVVYDLGSKETSEEHLIAEKDYLKGVSIENGLCTIGANATVSDLWNHPEINSYFPNLKKHLKN